MTRAGNVGNRLRWVERALLLGAALCISWVYVAWREADVSQQLARHELAESNRELARSNRDLATSNRALAESSNESADDTSTAEAPAANEVVAQDAVIGLLDVPRIGLSAAVREGDGEQALRLAVGHLPETPLPWRDGNVVLAGHRDTFFRPLRYLRVGDLMQFSTRHGTFEYRVRRLMIVDPEDVWVLNASDGVGLTLITCYPFKYVGSAPRRFVVQAQRVSGTEDHRQH